MLHVTSHAIMRYQERVSDVSPAEADRALRSSTIRLADRFGAPIVRLPGGQRAVLRDHAVVTILPADCVIGCLDRRRGHHDHQELTDG